MPEFIKDSSSPIKFFKRFIDVVFPGEMLINKDI